jgi:hypothetical protein
MTRRAPPGLPSLTMIARKFVMLASRAETSQHTLVTVPVNQYRVEAAGAQPVG